MRILLFIGILLVSVQGLGQQIPQYSHYVFNQFQLNPAVAGLNQCLDLRFGFRNQWAGFDDGPKTQFGSINTRIGKQKKKDSSWHGVGLKFETDRASRFSQSLVQLAYAYHFHLSRNTTGHVGVFFGFNQFKTDLANSEQNPLIYYNQNDPIVEQNDGRSFLFPEITPGIWVQNETFFLGLSAKHVFGNTILEEEGEAKLLTHINLTAGKALPIGQKMNFIPSLRASFIAPAPLAIDVNAMIDYDRKLAIGLGYRNGDALIGLMKFNFLNYFTLGYAYDFTISDLSAISRSTHEVMLGISACPGAMTGKHNPCAAYN